MICEVSKQNEQDFFARLAQTPVFSSAMHTGYATLGGKGQLARFYLAGEHAAVQITDTSAMVCGQVDDAEEMDSFLNFCGVQRAKTTSYTPYGFVPTQLHLLEYTGDGVTPPIPVGTVLDTEPRMIPLSITPCLGDGTGVRADGFAADACARRNRGLAEIWALQNEAGEYVATAGVYAIAPWEAYIAAVATREDWRRHGAAGYLVSGLAQKYAQRAVRLLCNEDKVPFYTRLGFTAVGGVMQYEKAQEPAL